MRKRRFWRCGEEWEDEDEQMQERQSGDTHESRNGEMWKDQNGDTTPRRDLNEPYRGTSPMGTKEGVSLGVDVSHLAPPVSPVDAEVIDRANEGSDDFGGDKGREKERDRDKERGRETIEKDSQERQMGEEITQWPDKVYVPGGVPKAPPSVLSSGGTGTLINPSRPVLDEAISWDRLDARRESKKRKWWYMP
ncbi:hypothetical protein BN14_04600 [Rhizoctonia solani AG-1 IB]|uniref:Uncharacterized protein n=1 Tax=Thanatephorus cucumeris (strain AG1-IB / isolate 7/3/14) TaxID=1108050 RepID=M5BVL7_THACB|nr:hypothetical protein BN14_04600 [Rhizoctonia solani AG-1 IB]